MFWLWVILFDRRQHLFSQFLKLFVLIAKHICPNFKKYKAEEKRNVLPLYLTGGNWERTITVITLHRNRKQNKYIQSKDAQTTKYIRNKVFLLKFNASAISVNMSQFERALGISGKKEDSCRYEKQHIRSDECFQGVHLQIESWHIAILCSYCQHWRFSGNDVF